MLDKMVRCRSPKCIRRGSGCVRPNAWQVYQRKQSRLRASRGRKGLKSRSAARLYRKARRPSSRQLCRYISRHRKNSRGRATSKSLRVPPFPVTSSVLPLAGASSLLPPGGVLPLAGASSLSPPAGVLTTPDNWRLLTVRAAAILLGTTVDLKMHSDTWNRWDELPRLRIDSVDARGVELSNSTEDVSLSANADGTLTSRGSMRPVLFMRSTSALGGAGFPSLTL